jgi:hypothetical protein
MFFFEDKNDLEVLRELYQCQAVSLHMRLVKEDSGTTETNYNIYKLFVQVRCTSR